ncbi:MAG: hypothetical protein QF415_03805 [Candidatus Undinarchaeales archaeon]|nr:hypothetical protein [Candidatus Undinarchaeales archaeon]MDP7491358.1 hypothetical protein [Candidatus Undinarchaeales archaeon]
MPTVGRRVIRKVMKKTTPPEGPSREIVERIDRDKARLHNWMEGNIDRIKGWKGEERRIRELEHRFEEVEEEASVPITVDESRILEHDIGLLEDHITALERSSAFKELKGQPAVKPTAQVRTTVAGPAPRVRPATMAAQQRPGAPPRPGAGERKATDDVLERIDGVLDKMEQTMGVWANATRISPEKVMRSKRRSGEGLPQDKYQLVGRFLANLVQKGTLGPASGITRERVLRSLPGIYAGVAKYLKVTPEEVRLSPQEEEKLAAELVQAVTR